MRRLWGAVAAFPEAVLDVGERSRLHQEERSMRPVHPAAFGWPGGRALPWLDRLETIVRKTFAQSQPERDAKAQAEDGRTTLVESCEGVLTFAVASM
jgi:hypothetical protein